MTFDEAVEEAKKGKKIVHEYFCTGEYFEYKNGVLVCEQGCSMAGWYRGESWQKEGWRTL